MAAGDEFTERRTKGNPRLRPARAAKEFMNVTIVEVFARRLDAMPR